MFLIAVFHVFCCFRIQTFTFLVLFFGFLHFCRLSPLIFSPQCDSTDKLHNTKHKQLIFFTFKGWKTQHLKLSAVACDMGPWAFLRWACHKKFENHCFTRSLPPSITRATIPNHLQAHPIVAVRFWGFRGLEPPLFFFSFFSPLCLNPLNPPNSLGFYSCWWFV